jgi:hypothetical protein
LKKINLIFLKKSLFIYALKNSLDLKFNTKNSYLTSLISINNGLLKKTSANCFHTIVIFNDKKNNKHNRFFKIVPYSEKFEGDCIIVYILMDIFLII